MEVPSSLGFESIRNEYSFESRTLQSRLVSPNQQLHISALPHFWNGKDFLIANADSGLRPQQKALMDNSQAACIGTSKPPILSNHAKGEEFTAEYLDAWAQFLQMSKKIPNNVLLSPETLMFEGSYYSTSCSNFKDGSDWMENLSNSFSSDNSWINISDKYLEELSITDSDEPFTDTLPSSMSLSDSSQMEKSPSSPTSLWDKTSPVSYIKPVSVMEPDEYIQQDQNVHSFMEERATPEPTLLETFEGFMQFPMRNQHYVDKTVSPSLIYSEENYDQHSADDNNKSTSSVFPQNTEFYGTSSQPRCSSPFWLSKVEYDEHCGDDNGTIFAMTPTLNEAKNIERASCDTTGSTHSFCGPFHFSVEKDEHPRTSMPDSLLLETKLEKGLDTGLQDKTNTAAKYEIKREDNDSINTWASKEVCDYPANQTDNEELPKKLNKRDNLLVTLKRQGLSYREIKERYEYKEAESTLRGRFRALTKPRDQRVRKPTWRKKDVQLLVQAVKGFQQGAFQSPQSEFRYVNSHKGRKSSSLPWKSIAEYIRANGGSYHFGNATCKKKWDEIKSGDRPGKSGLKRG